MPTVVLDPGHGGNTRAGSSKPNNATSPTGILEKNLTLELARLVRGLLREPPAMDVYMTRDADVNLSLTARARHNQQHDADLFLSIHFNGYNGVFRGVETIVWPPDGNVNYAADRAWAARLQAAVFNAIRRRDSSTRNRPMKQRKFPVLSDRLLGNEGSEEPSVACLLEVEFIDVPAVDHLLNGPDGPVVRREIASAIAGAVRRQLSSTT